MRPSAVNAPASGIYFLLESRPKRVELQMPDDAFRFTDEGVEFIVMETNTLDAGKSARFTEVLRERILLPAPPGGRKPDDHEGV